MRQSFCTWALGTAAVAVGLVLGGAASTAQNTAVPQDIVVSAESAGGAGSAAAAPPRGSDTARSPAPAPEPVPHAAPLRIRLAGSVADDRPESGSTGPAGAATPDERSPAKRENPRGFADPVATGVRLGPP
ncbi:hypothetical protein [Streptomonospora salina]|uniref:Zn-dependent M28 family amino/carboxypeptidase n=1 Tax=Streptomonospora salina TaxID=104205 RepID=A0A841E8K6_9ACTN|nr:hypothetical protein [Streptomonospora salina]MBB5999465.1 Zn-dependent M28 family amino/carboxypeptidase [Streptomonospora salina]